MLVKLQLNKASTANWLFLSFFIILVAGTAISEFFQAPDQANQQLNQYRSLLYETDLSGINKLVLKNRLGEFFLKKNEHSEWELTSPRQLPADTKVIEEIFEALKKIRIRRIYPKDQINIANFSLDTPLMSLTYKKPDKEPVEIKLGLVNPIDNSTYVMMSNRDAIYHIDALRNSMEILGLADFVDSKVFGFNPNNVNSVRIYQKEVKDSRLRLEFSKEEGKWYGENDADLQPTKVNDFLERLRDIKSQFILDKMSDELSRSLSWYMKNPAYFVVIETSDRGTITYEVSSIVTRSVPDLKVEKSKNFIIQASKFTHPYIVSRDHFKVFQTRQKRFERLPFEKLFY